MYVYVGVQGKRYKTIVSVDINPISDVDDARAVGTALEWTEDREELQLDAVQVWRDGEYVCSLDLC